MTRPKCPGCASNLKISTAPQRDQFDTHKVPRGLREGSGESDLTRASADGFREHMLEFHQILRAPRKMNIESVKCETQFFSLGCL
jgi:hypothetical protein